VAQSYIFPSEHKLLSIFIDMLIIYYA